MMDQPPKTKNNNPPTYMNALIDSTFVPLLLKSIGFLVGLPCLADSQAGIGSLPIDLLARGDDWATGARYLQPLGADHEIKLSSAGPSASPAVTGFAPESGWRVLDAPDGTRSIGAEAGGAVSVANELAVKSTTNPLLAAWLIGSSLLAALWLLAQVQLSRMRSKGVASSGWAELLHQCRSALGQRIPVRLEFSDTIAMPCAWGILKPTVMLPKDAESWGGERRRMVVLHELSHLKRMDPLYDLVGRVCVIIFWLNPLSWLAFKQLRLAAERATDDAVLAGGCAAKPYAAVLLQFAKEGLAGRRRPLAAATPMAQPSTVGIRVEKLLDPFQKRSAPRKLRTLALLGATVLCAAAIGGLQSSRAQVRPPAQAGGQESPRAENALTGVEFIRNKLRKTIIPEISFTEATLEEAVIFLRKAAVLNDETEVNEDQKGVNILIKKWNPKEKAKPKPINLQLSNVPLVDALKFTTELAGCRYVIDPLAVVIIPPFTEDGSLLTATFRVPTGFLGPAGVRRETGRSILESAGIHFPQGAAASYISATSELVVRNTQTNMDLVEAFVDILIQEEKNRKPVNMRAEIYSLPKVQALGFLEQYERAQNAAEAVGELRKLAAAGKAKLLASPSLSMVGGESATIGTGTAHDYTASYVEAEGQDRAVAGSCFVGTTITFEPRVDLDGLTLNADIKIEQTFGDPVIEKISVLAPVSGKQMPAERVTIDRATIDTSAKLFSGQTRMLGSLSPSRGAGDEMLLVFVKAWVSAVGQQPPPRIEPSAEALVAAGSGSPSPVELGDEFLLF